MARTGTPTGVAAGIGEPVIAAARAGEPDRYLAALLAPVEVRPALLALAAFASELASVPLRTVREPVMSEIRLQWWRDTLEQPEGVASGHPIADAVRDAIAGGTFSRAVLLDMISSYGLRVEAPRDDDALRQRLHGTESAMFLQTALALGDIPTEALRAACLSGGEAYGIARLLCGLPQAFARGHMLLPLSRLQAVRLTPHEVLTGHGGGQLVALVRELQTEARASLRVARGYAANLGQPVRVAFLPLALVEAYLRCLEPFDERTWRAGRSIGPVVRLAKIAAAHWLGRL